MFEHDFFETERARKSKLKKLDLPTLIGLKAALMLKHFEEYPPASIAAQPLVEKALQLYSSESPLSERWAFYTLLSLLTAHEIPARMEVRKLVLDKCPDVYRAYLKGANGSIPSRCELRSDDESFLYDRQLIDIFVAHGVEP